MSCALGCGDAGRCGRGSPAVDGGGGGACRRDAQPCRPRKDNPGDPSSRGQSGQLRRGRRCAAGAEPRIHLLRRPPRSPQLSPPRLCGPRWSPCRSGLPADPADPRLLTPHPEQSPARTWAVVSDAVGCVEGALRPVAQVGQHQAPVTQITMSVYTVAALPGPWGCSRDSTTACSALAPWPSPSLPTATLPAHGAQTVPLLGVHI
ncbi:uncharacterized protein LOC125755972 isoform X2 [Canis lupus dingo]|uniref:uncharacterized protein LOC125755972 isoform X2 n=1 Tax=Canis lupus dingo TaxID=286419 RepID=UPI0006B3D4D0|nr:uncharacterized protein LOC125755972 isoform X2 [Canis lupus dingo]